MHGGTRYAQRHCHLIKLDLYTSWPSRSRASDQALSAYLRCYSADNTSPCWPIPDRTFRSMTLYKLFLITALLCLFFHKLTPQKKGWSFHLHPFFLSSDKIGAPSSVILYCWHHNPCCLLHPIIISLISYSYTLVCNPAFLTTFLFLLLYVITHLWSLRN
jgi:hypothetical protein